MIASVLNGDALETLRQMPDECVQVCITSPPYYGLRDYGHRGQIGAEPTPQEYVERLVQVFGEVRRVLKKDGTLWLNLGDSYNARTNGGHAGGKNGFHIQRNGAASYQPRSGANVPGLKPKDLLGIPWQVAFALRADGWYLRQDIIWHKPNPMPESVRDRCTKAHEYVFLMSKSQRYLFDGNAIKDPYSKNSLKKHANAKTSLQKDKYREGTKSSRNDSKSSFFINGEGRFTRGGRNRRSVWTITPKPFNQWKETVHWVRVSKDDVCDGMLHIASANCPLHGCQGRLSDAREDATSSHTRNTCSRRAAGQANDSFETKTLFDPLRTVSTSDYCCQGCLSFANGRNKKTNKNDRAQLLVEQDNVFSQTPPDKFCIQDASVAIVQRCYMPASNTLVDDLADGQLFEMPNHTVHTSCLPVSLACLCGYYRRTTKKSTHFATMPPALVEPCILAGSSEGDIVLDPFSGAGTTGLVALQHGRHYVGIELNAEYIMLTGQRFKEAGFELT